MLDTLLAKVFGTQNERELKRVRPLVAEINSREPPLRVLSDSQLQAKTADFRAQVERGAALDAVLPDAFAVIAARSPR